MMSFASGGGSRNKEIEKGMDGRRLVEKNWKTKTFPLQNSPTSRFRSSEVERWLIEVSQASECVDGSASDEDHKLRRRSMLRMTATQNEKYMSFRDLQTVQIGELDTLE